VNRVSVAEIADLVSIARDLLLFLLLLVILVSVVLLYRKASRLLDLTRRTAESVESFTTTISDSIIEPAKIGSSVLTRTINLLQGIFKNR
jgi:hypothetical protein